MTHKPIIVFCPNPYSLYTTSVCELLIRKGFQIDSIVVRQFSYARFRQEFKRDGSRLLKKIWRKLILKEKAYAVTDQIANEDDLLAFRKQNCLTIRKVNEFEKFGSRIIYCKNLNDKIVEKELLKYPQNLVIFTGGGILRNNILKLSDGIINCHMGILPRYKGMDLPEWCILENQIDQLGISVHLMDSGIDTGAILKTVKVDLAESKDIKELRNKFEPFMVSAICSSVEELTTGKLNPVLQQTFENRQYFMVHPKLYALVNKRLLSLRPNL